MATAAAGALAILGFALSASAPADPSVTGAPFTATGTIEAAFTPGDRIDNLIIAAIAGAKHEVLVNAYSFTQRRIAGALVAARKRGVAVQVIADSQQAATLPQNVLGELAKGDVAVWLDSNYQAAHNKVVIVDAFVGAHPEFTLGDAAAELRRAGVALDTGRTLKLSTARHGCDGFFAAVLERP
jgi:phosphatidylserine/phosphatidylglycerophosphate/cardiolipin synthase-like enzyme